MSTTPPTSPPPGLSRARSDGPLDAADAGDIADTADAYATTRMHRRKRSHEQMSQLPVRSSPDSLRQSAQPGQEPSVQHLISSADNVERHTPPAVMSLSKPIEPNTLPSHVPHLNEDIRHGEQTPASAPELSPGDPMEEIEPFDWHAFEMRYRKAVEEQDKAQQNILDEFRRMIHFFGVWAMSSVDHENDRSAKRVKTRMTYVQGAEASLSEKREHYIKVVAAFESALALLGAP